MFYSRRFATIDYVKELTKKGKTSMNLHEECLLQYLKCPDGLSFATDVLKLNNHILEQHFLVQNILTKNLKLDYNSKHV